MAVGQWEHGGCWWGVGGLYSGGRAVGAMVVVGEVGGLYSVALVVVGGSPTVSLGNKRLPRAAERSMRRSGWPHNTMICHLFLVAAADTDTPPSCRFV